MNNGDEQLEQIFDEAKLDRAIKKGKRKSIKKTILISLVVAAFVFITVTIGNIFLTLNMSNKAYDSIHSYVSLTVPNGYISKSLETISFLGGRADYTISRTVGDKPVILENRTYGFGYLPQKFSYRGSGAGGHKAGEWPTHYWEYGYNRMLFFHPQISYKEYKNDLANLSEVADGKVIEVGISFDKPYTISELSKILPDVDISWYWVDAFRDEDMERYEEEAAINDAKSTYISESEVLGVTVRSQRAYHFGLDYSSFLEHLNAIQSPQFEDIYNELNAKGYTDSDKVPILGMIASGTKEQLESLIDNPLIKASSFGVIIDQY